MIQNKKTRHGFTLLELLVVISIIGILLALGTVAFATAQRKGRDSKRVGDIKALQNGFEQYYVQNGSSYGTCAQMMADNSIFPGGAPSDPKGNDGDVCRADYCCNETADGYCICATLETGIGNATGSECDGLGTTNGDYYCLTNLQ